MAACLCKIYLLQEKIDGVSHGYFQKRWCYCDTYMWVRKNIPCNRTFASIVIRYVTSIWMLVTCCLAQTVWQLLWYHLRLWKMEKQIFKWQVCQTKHYFFIFGVIFSILFRCNWKFITSDIKIAFFFSLSNAVCCSCKSPGLPCHICPCKQCLFILLEHKYRRSLSGFVKKKSCWGPHKTAKIGHKSRQRRIDYLMFFVLFTGSIGNGGLQLVHFFIFFLLIRQKNKFFF